MQIKNLSTTDEIAKSFDVFLELKRDLYDVQSFINQVIIQQKEGYSIFAITEDEEILSCIGFRIFTTLACGRILYIDDLVTKKKYQRKGYAKILLDYVIGVASNNECRQVHLDTGYNRHIAHKLYLNQGFELYCHHLVLNL